MIHLHQFLIKIHIDITTIALQRLDLGIAQKILQDTTATAALMLGTILIKEVLKEENHNTSFLVNKAPHIRFPMAEVGLVTTPRLINIHIRTRF